MPAIYTMPFVIFIGLLFPYLSIFTKICVYIINIWAHLYQITNNKSVDKNRSSFGILPVLIYSKHCKKRKLIKLSRDIERESERARVNSFFWL